MTVAIYGRSIEPEFFPYLKRLVEGLERKGVGMVCEEKFAVEWKLQLRTEIFELFRQMYLDKRGG